LTQREANYGESYEKQYGFFRPVIDIEDSGQVLYRSAMTHGKNKKNFELVPAEEFIARVTQHIPEKGFQMVRYYGWYSNRSMGQRHKEGMLRPGDNPPDIGRI
jgi:hypothetical protein